MIKFNSALACVVASAFGFTASVSQAAVYDYSGTICVCSNLCDLSAALGGPGGASNPVASIVTGSVNVNVAPNGSFTEADIGNFGFAIVNPGAPIQAPMFDDQGMITNQFEINPIAFDQTLAVVTGTGTVDAQGELASGSLILTFTGSGLADANASFFINLTTGGVDGFVFGGTVQLFAIDGQFSLRPVPLPAGIWLLASALVGGGLLRRR